MQISFLHWLGCSVFLKRIITFKSFCFLSLIFPNVPSPNTYIHNLLVPSFVTFPLIFYFFLSIWTQQRERREKHKMILLVFLPFSKDDCFCVYCDVHKVHWPRHSALARTFNALHTTEYTEWQRPLSCVHSIMIKLAQAGEGGGDSNYHHVQSCRVRSSWEGRYGTLPLFLLYIYILCDTHSGYLFGLIRKRQLFTFSLKVYNIYSTLWCAGSPSLSCSCWVRPVSSSAPSSRPWTTSARTSSSCTPITASQPRSSR